jgi:hypothetical protein
MPCRMFAQGRWLFILLFPLHSIPTILLVLNANACITLFRAGLQ